MSDTRIYKKPHTIIAPVWWLKEIVLDYSGEYSDKTLLELPVEDVMKAVVDMGKSGEEGECGNR